MKRMKRKHPKAINQSATEKRKSLIIAHTTHIMEAWAASGSSGIDAPVVLISVPSSGDTLARALTGDKDQVGLVSAKELVRVHGRQFAEEVTIALATLRPSALFVVCVAFGGASAGYIVMDKNTGGLGMTTGE